MVCLILVYKQSVFNKIHLLITVILWVVMVLLQVLPYPLWKLNTGVESVPFGFYCIFITYTMFPTSRRMSCLLGVITSLLNILLATFCNDIHEFPIDQDKVEARLVSIKALQDQEGLRVCSFCCGHV